MTTDWQSAALEAYRTAEKFRNQFIETKKICDELKLANEKLSAENTTLKSANEKLTKNLEKAKANQADDTDMGKEFLIMFKGMFEIIREDHERIMSLFDQNRPAVPPIKPAIHEFRRKIDMMSQSMPLHETTVSGANPSPELTLLTDSNVTRVLDEALASDQNPGTGAKDQAMTEFIAAKVQ